MKPNKTKRTITQAEMNRRVDKAFRSAVAIMLLCVAETERFSDDELQELWDSINARAESIDKHYCTLEDIRKTLLEEYGITLGGSLA